MKSNLFSLSCCSVALAMLSAAPAAFAEGTNKQLLDVLVKNGTISQKQYDEMMGKVEAEEKEKKKAAKTTLDQRGFRVQRGDDSYAIKIGGRLHTQAAMHLNDRLPNIDPNDGTELRRARIELSGTIQEDWRWAAETEYSNNAVRVIDFWLAYTGFEDVTLTFGHQKQPYSLSVEMSSNDIAFIERSIDNYLVIPFVDRAIGLRMDTHGKDWFFAGGLFGESVPPTSTASNPNPLTANVLNNVTVGTGAGTDGGNEGWGAMARFIYAPVVTDNSIVHLGMRGAHRIPADNRQSIRVRDETHNFSDTSIVDTGNIANVDSTTLYGPEIGLSYGPFTLLGEYNVAQIDREVGTTLEFSSWHVGLHWLFGAAPYAKSYRLDNGEFKRPVPLKDFTLEHGGGALELAGRYASIDLNDGRFVGGTQDTTSLAANFYMNNNVRLMFDWTHILDTDDSSVIRREADGLSVIQTRAQWTY